MYCIPIKAKMTTYMYTVYKDAVSPTTEEKALKTVTRNKEVKDFLNKNGIHFPINTTYFENNINRLLPILNQIENLILVLVFKEDGNEKKVNCIGQKVNKTFENLNGALSWLLKEYENVNEENVNLITHKIV